MSQRPEFKGGNANNILEDSSLEKSDLNQSHSQADARVEGSAVTVQPVSIKSWLQKFLVIALCAMSFYAGWQAKESSIVRQCLESGGTIDAEAPVLSCQWP